MTVVTILLSLILAAAKAVKREKSAVRKLEDQKVMDVVTDPGGYKYRLLPNLYFWILLILETILIAVAYLFRHYEIII
jgi:hypothetical protein